MRRRYIPVIVAAGRLMPFDRLVIVKRWIEGVSVLKKSPDKSGLFLFGLVNLNLFFLVG
jgi:hypothetical protein